MTATILLNLTSCGKMVSAPVTPDIPLLDETEINHATSPEDESPYTFPDTNSFSTSMLFEQSAETSWMASGSILHQINRIRIVSKAKDIPESGGFKEYDPVCIYDRNGKETTWQYPDFIGNDGSFSDGIRILLIDITVTSNNAVNWTINDLDDDGNPLGLYDDPYVFRLDGSYILETESNDKEYPFSWNWSYFSGMDSDSHHPYAYKLLPGEVKEYTIGFLIGTDYDGNYREISDYWIRVVYGPPGSKKWKDSYIYLDDSIISK